MGRRNTKMYKERMSMKSSIRLKLHHKRILTEKKIRQLEKENKAGQRYTATISDIHFLITGLLCDVGWITHLIFEIKYLNQYHFHLENSHIFIFDILSLITLIMVNVGIIYTIYLNIIHEKEIALRCQKNLSFGMTITGGLLSGIIALIQLWLTSIIGRNAIECVFVIAGGFINFIFGLPIFLSFKKGIIYSDEIK